MPDCTLSVEVCTEQAPRSEQLQALRSLTPEVEPLDEAAAAVLQRAKVRYLEITGRRFGNLAGNNPKVMEYARRWNELVSKWTGEIVVRGVEVWAHSLSEGDIARLRFPLAVFLCDPDLQEHLQLAEQGIDPYLDLASPRTRANLEVMRSFLDKHSHEEADAAENIDETDGESVN